MSTIPDHDLPDRQQLAFDLSRQFDLEGAGSLSMADLETLLAAKLNRLIQDDFNALIGILYRIDVDETRLKKLLRENTGADAGLIMARLIIERQWQKLRTRKGL